MNPIKNDREMFREALLHRKRNFVPLRKTVPKSSLGVAVIRIKSDLMRLPSVVVKTLKVQGFFFKLRFATELI